LQAYTGLGVESIIGFDGQSRADLIFIFKMHKTTGKFFKSV
jgi:hypothetical protein